MSNLIVFFSKPTLTYPWPVSMKSTCKALCACVGDATEQSMLMLTGHLAGLSLTACRWAISTSHMASVRHCSEWQEGWWSKCVSEIVCVPSAFSCHDGPRMNRRWKVYKLLSSLFIHWCQKTSMLYRPGSFTVISIGGSVECVHAWPNYRRARLYTT